MSPLGSCIKEITQENFILLYILAFKRSEYGLMPIPIAKLILLTNSSNGTATNVK